jgi:hypothetical protein
VIDVPGRADDYGPHVTGSGRVSPRAPCGLAAGPDATLPPWR